MNKTLGFTKFSKIVILDTLSIIAAILSYIMLDNNKLASLNILVFPSAVSMIYFYSKRNLKNSNEHLDIQEKKMLFMINELTNFLIAIMFNLLFIIMLFNMKVISDSDFEIEYILICLPMLIALFVMLFRAYRFRKNLDDRQ
jgi:hypothetical protein